MAEVITLALLAAVGGAYAFGLSRAWAAAGRGRLVRASQAWLFAAGTVALGVALLPPLDTGADHSLTAHMIQHVLLLVVAAPLMALGAPLPTFIWALPTRWRPRASAAWRRLLRSHRSHWPAWAVGAFVVASLDMVGWHLPVAYRAALHHDALHMVEHASFLLSAIAFWWAVGLGSTGGHGAAVAVVFAAALPGSALGAALTLASRTWYPEYPSLSDQQMAGVVMWAFAGVAYVLAAACLFGVWLRRLESETPGRPLAAAATP